MCAFCKDAEETTLHVFGDCSQIQDHLLLDVHKAVSFGLYTLYKCNYLKNTYNYVFL